MENVQTVTGKANGKEVITGAEIGPVINRVDAATEAAAKAQAEREQNELVSFKLLFGFILGSDVAEALGLGDVKAEKLAVKMADTVRYMLYGDAIGKAKAARLDVVTKHGQWTLTEAPDQKTEAIERHNNEVNATLARFDKLIASLTLARGRK